MDAEHRVDGQEGMPGTPPDGGSLSSSEPGGGASDGGAPAEHRAEGGTAAEAGAPSEGSAAREGGVRPGEGSPEGAQAGEAARGGAEASPHEASEAEPRLPPEQRHADRVTTVLLPLEKLEEDTTFRLREEGDVSGLATDVARLGQLFPVDVRPRGEDRYQLVCGFRRVAALRFLKRDAVLARVHLSLSDEDALLMSLAEAIHASPVEPEVLQARREQLEEEGRLTAPVRDMLDKALATEDSLAPESVEEEVDADELAADAAQRLGALNQDLALLADVFSSLDESRRAELLMQLRYSSELVAFLEGL